MTLKKRDRQMDRLWVELKHIAIYFVAPSIKRWGLFSTLEAGPKLQSVLTKRVWQVIMSEMFILGLNGFSSFLLL